MDDRDKRDYFRLPDSILVEYQFVPDKEVAAGDARDFFTSSPNFHLLKDIYELQLESKELLRGLQQDNRQLGRFLTNLDARVELISQSLVSSTTQDYPLEDCDAEISEGGLSFLSKELIPTGQHLALRMLFQPSFLGLVCFGEVRHCQLTDNDYRIGVAFKHIDLQTQRISSRHIVARQSEARRARLHQ